MLMVFNLDWKRFSIATQVAEANAFMQLLVTELGLSERIIFNCASMGAGEWLLKGKQGQESIDSNVLERIRQEHQDVIETLRADRQYRLNHETREMLHALRRAGHNLVAVFAGATNQLETVLCDARCRDAFEDNVIGYDRLHDSRRADKTGMAVYREAFRRCHIEPVETIIVTDDADGVLEAKCVGPQAVVGYVASAETEAEKDRRISDLESANPDYTLIGGSSVACLPFWFDAWAGQRVSRVATSEFLKEMVAQAAAGYPPPDIH